MYSVGVLPKSQSQSQSSVSKLCKFHIRPGGCTNSNCKFDHPTAEAMSRTPCHYKDGCCPYASCPFEHVQPQAQAMSPGLQQQLQYPHMAQPQAQARSPGSLQQLQYPHMVQHQAQAMSPGLQQQLQYPHMVQYQAQAMSPGLQHQMHLLQYPYMAQPQAQDRSPGLQHQMHLLQYPHMAQAQARSPGPQYPHMAQPQAQAMSPSQPQAQTREPVSEKLRRTLPDSEFTDLFAVIKAVGQHVLPIGEMLERRIPGERVTLLVPSSVSLLQHLTDGKFRSNAIAIVREFNQDAYIHFPMNAEKTANKQVLHNGEWCVELSIVRNTPKDPPR